MDQAVSPSSAIGPGITRTAIPDWVALEDYAVHRDPPADFITHGRCVLLEEDQVDLTGPERAWFFRRAELVVANAGAEAASRFEAVFDPTYQRLEVHRIWVKRGEQIIVHEASDGFEIMRRERNLEQRIFDGGLTVHLAIPDVRPGDIVETAYSLFGERPVLKDRHAAWKRFEYFGLSVFDLRSRLRTPAGRIVKTKAYNGAPSLTETESDGVLDRRWRSTNTKSMKHEPLAPSWIFQSAELQFSEWRDWLEVRDAFAPGYEPESVLPPSLLEEIDKIVASDLPPDARFMAALRFAQGSVRYLAVAIGNGGLVPRTIEDIWTTRYGDCKDKSKLLTIIAKRLGLDVCPALVNTRAGHGIDAWLPTSNVFDHCIVRYREGDKIYWFDPTNAVQQSPLETAQQSHFGWALPLAEGVSNLEWMPEPAVETTLSVRERISFEARPSDPVRYEWRTTYRRARAEWMRELIAREGAGTLFKGYTQDVQKRWAKAQPVRQEVLEDNIAANEITLIEVYEISDAWIENGANYGFATLDLYLKRPLALLEPGELHYPIFLGAIGRTERRVEIESKAELPCPGWRREGDAEALQYKNAFFAESSTFIVLEVEMTVKTRTLPPEKAKQYRDLINELDQGDIVLRLPATKGKFVAVNRQPTSSGGNWWWIWLAIMGLSALARAFGGGQ